MSSEATCPITLSVAGDPRLARLVRMTAANVGALCSMSVDRIEDIRMAAEEAFIFGHRGRLRRHHDQFRCGRISRRHDLYLWGTGHRRRG